MCCRREAQRERGSKDFDVTTVGVVAGDVPSSICCELLRGRPAD